MNENALFSALIAEMTQRATSNEDKTLLGIFVDNQDRIASVLDSSLPQNNEWANFSGRTVDFLGPTFHKAFRQTDVLATGELDMKVWRILLRDGCFWDSLASALKALNMELV